MNSRRRWIRLSVGLAILFPTVLLAQDILLQVRVFKGTLTKDQAPPILPDILSASSNPHLATLREKVNGTEGDLKTAAMESLLKTFDLQALDQMFSFILLWNGHDSILSEGGVLNHAAFRFEFAPQWHFSQYLSLGFCLYKKEISSTVKSDPAEEKKILGELNDVLHPTQYQKRMDIIFNKNIPLPVGDPMIVAVSHDGQVYFVFLLAADRPQPIHQVFPAYPQELAQKGVRGQGRYRISMDEKGTVMKARVLNSLHPYLDSSAIQALQQWKFAPVIRDGRAVPVSFDWTINFDPARWLQSEAFENRLAEPVSSELQRVLELGAAYCRKLAGAALDFVCEETIKDTNFVLNIPEEMKADGRTEKTYSTGGAESIKVSSRRQSLRPNPYKTKVNRYVCDYQMIKKGNRIEERRFIQKENGRLIEAEKKLLEEKRIMALRPLFAPSKVFDQDRQPLFNFRLLGEERQDGRKAVVVEAAPKTGAPGGIRKAKVWIDEVTFQILKSEIQGIPPEGYESELEEANQIGKELICTMTSTYSVEKNGVLFPSQAEVLVEYPLNLWGYSKRTRLETIIRYDQYKFFTVDTESRIIK
jgi:TonB family protein